MANQHTKKTERTVKQLLKDAKTIWNPDVTYSGEVPQKSQKYCAHPSGVECNTIAQHMAFNTGSALQHLWVSETRGNPAARIESLKNAAWYIQAEIERLGK